MTRVNMVMVECNETKNNKNICKYLNNKKHKYNFFLINIFKIMQLHYLVIKSLQNDDAT
jgi:hypothetical protein